MLVDSHCHLDFDAYDPDRAETIARARAAGVSAMVTICTQLSKFDRVRGIAESDPDIWCSVGVHPHEADGEGVDAPDPLLRLAEHPKVVGIGETGLDYHYDHSPRAAQRANFRAHIAAARTFGFTNEIEALRRANLIRGGSLDNAIVLTPEGMLNETGLRFRDEFVRHKILDIIGDLALLGMPILGKVVAERSGHIMHAGLMSKLLRVRSAWDIVDM